MLHGTGWLIHLRVETMANLSINSSSLFKKSSKHEKWQLHQTPSPSQRAVDKEMTPRCTSGMCRGVVKPDIVFFGENLPRRFWLHINDLSRADLLFVMGTSLEVS